MQKTCLVFSWLFQNLDDCSRYLYKHLILLGFYLRLPGRSNLHNLLLRVPFKVFPPNTSSPPGTFTIVCPSKAPGDPDPKWLPEVGVLFDSQEGLYVSGFSVMVEYLKTFRSDKNSIFFITMVKEKNSNYI